MKQMNRKFRSTLPYRYRDQLINIWKKTGRQPWFSSYVMDTQNGGGGMIKRFRGEGIIISGGFPFSTHPLQKWILADWVCAICEELVGMPEDGYLELLAEYDREIVAKRKKIQKQHDQRRRKAQQTGEP